MERLLTDFRRNPAAYLSSHGFSMQDFVDEQLQVLMTPPERNENTKMTILRLFQEDAPALFNDATTLESTLVSLKTIFHQTKTTANPLISSQILCAMTSILIEMEAVLEGDYVLREVVQVLFEVVEKVKLDGNQLVRATACDCLREIELAFPGILSSKVGHFYALSQADESHIFQHYLLLLSTVLDHTVKKCVLIMEQGHTPDPALSELLSQTDTLKDYSLPDDYRDTAKLLSKPAVVVPEEDSDIAEIRRAVSFILDHYHLLTPPCLALTLSNVISTVELTSLTPLIFKGLMLQYQSCQDLISFYQVLYLKWRFGGDICSDFDASTITFWFCLMSTHPCLSPHHKELILSYYLEWPQEELSPAKPAMIDSEGEMEEEEEEEEDQNEFETRSYREMLSPTVFDTYTMYYYKVKALNFQLSNDRENDDDVASSLPQLLSTVLSQVKYGIGGAPVTSLFRLLFSYYPGHTSRSSEISKLVIGIVKEYPKFIPYMIDFVSSIQLTFPDSSVPLQLLAGYLHHLSSSYLFLLDLPLFLLFLQQASQHLSINPLVVMQCLTRLVRDQTLCETGSWETGSTILNIINTILRTHSTNSVFKGLTDLLQLISTNYNDIDVQDRARFYNQLILSVSADKLAGILSLVSDSTAGSTLSDIVEARIADNTFPSAPPLLTISQPFLSLKRVNVKEERFYQRKIREGSDEMAVEYQENGVTGKCSFSLQYLVQFVSCPHQVSDQIFALDIRLSTDGPYQPCSDVCIPALCSRSSGAPTKSTEKLVMFEFFPKRPMPATFKARAIFSTEEGLSCVCDLDDVRVEFEDLLQPLPQHHLPKQVDYHEIFQQLWAKMESSQNQNTGQMDGDFSLLSTVHLDLNKTEWESMAKALQLLLLPSSNGTSDTLRYLVFLPPRYHLLMRVCEDSQRDGVDIRLATDYWKCMGLVSSYLNQLTETTLS